MPAVGGRSLVERSAPASAATHCRRQIAGPSFLFEHRGAGLAQCAGAAGRDMTARQTEPAPLKPLDNPFGTRLSPMSLVRSVTYLSGLDNLSDGAARGIRTPDP